METVIAGSLLGIVGSTSFIVVVGVIVIFIGALRGKENWLIGIVNWLAVAFGTGLVWASWLVFNIRTELVRNRDTALVVRSEQALVLGVGVVVLVGTAGNSVGPKRRDDEGTRRDGMENCAVSLLLLYSESVQKQTNQLSLTI